MPSSDLRELPPDEEARKLYAEAIRRHDDAMAAAGDEPLPTLAPPPRPRRVVIELDPDQVADALRRVYPTLPEDLRVVGATYEPVRHGYRLLLQSDSFPDTPRGECYPEIAL